MTGASLTVRKILVLRGGALGDFILTMPALAVLRRRYPAAVIELRTRPRHARLALAAGLADRAADIDGAEMAEVFAPASAGGQILPSIYSGYLAQFDLIASYLPDRNGTLARNLRRAGIQNYIAVPHRPAAGEHAADAWICPLRAPHDHDAKPAIPRLNLPETFLQPGSALLRGIGAGRPAAVIHPGSGNPAKNWPTANFIELADWLKRDCGWQPVFMLGEAEASWPAQILKPWPVVAQPDLAQAAGILAASRLYIGNDSGITHLAASLNTPVVALFGPTDPAAWGPRGPRVQILRAPGPVHAMSGLSTAEAQLCCRILIAGDSRG